MTGKNYKKIKVTRGNWEINNNFYRKKSER